jgi:hypothetical protein
VITFVNWKAIWKPIWKSVWKYTVSAETSQETPTGGWGWLPEYRFRRKRETVETVEQVENRILTLQRTIEARKALRQAEQKDQEVTAQLREIYAEQDALALSEKQLKALLSAQQQEDDDITLILALAS